MFDLKEYLNCIGLPNQGSVADENTLFAVVHQHLVTFPYQNTELFSEGKKPAQQRSVKSVALNDVFKQMVMDHRPGYCYQNAELLFGALQALKFQVQRLTARVINLPCEQVEDQEVQRRPFIHEILLVSLDKQRWIVDTAFANNSLRYPMLFDAGEHSIAGDIYQLKQYGDEWRLSMQIDQKWFCLYQIGMQIRSEQDIVDENKALFLTEKTVPIRDRFLKVALVTDTKRKSLIAEVSGCTFFKSHSINKADKKRELTQWDEVTTLVDKKFSIQLPEEVRLF